MIEASGRNEAKPHCAVRAREAMRLAVAPYDDCARRGREVLPC